MNADFQQILARVYSQIHRTIEDIEANYDQSGEDSFEKAFYRGTHSALVSVLEGILEITEDCIIPEDESPIVVESPTIH